MCESTRLLLLVRVLSMALFVGLVIALPESISACPNCKNAVAQSSPPGAAAFAWSIALMLLVPVTILGGWMAAFFALRNRAAKSPCPY